MKKKTKNLLLLVVVFVLLVVGYFAMDLIMEKTEEETLNTTAEVIEVTEFTVEDITSYWYENSSYKMGFEVTAEGYVNQEDPEFPMVTDNVSSQLDAIGSMTAIQRIESTDKAEYGLMEPQVAICVTLSDGTKRTFSIGDKALFEEAYYVSDEDNNLIYLVSSAQCSAYQKTWSAMVQMEEKISLTTDQILDVTVENAGEQTMYLSYNEMLEYPWQIITPEETLNGDSDAVLEALGAFGSYEIESTVEYDCTDFSQYGLEEPATKVTVRYMVPSEDTSEEAASEDMGKEEILTLTFEFGDVNEEGIYYTRINGSEYVYGLSQYYAESLSVFHPENLMTQPEEETDTAEK